jgi:hypothetical protein
MNDYDDIEKNQVSETLLPTEAGQVEVEEPKSFLERVADGLVPFIALGLFGCLISFGTIQLVWAETYFKQEMVWKKSVALYLVNNIHHTVIGTVIASIIPIYVYWRCLLENWRSLVFVLSVLESGILVKIVQVWIYPGVNVTTCIANLLNFIIVCVFVRIDEAVNFTNVSAVCLVLLILSLAYGTFIF